MGRETADPTGTARAAIKRLCAGGLAPLVLLREVAGRVHDVVPYAAAGWQLTDPATLLATGGFAENVDPDVHLRLIENELTGADFASFPAVARSRAAVTTLTCATDGDLTRSPRYRTVNAAVGWDDELRAVFRSGGTSWGQVCMARAAGEPRFSAEDAAFLAGVGAYVGAGLRTGLLLDRAGSARPNSGAPGLVVLHDDGSVDAVSDDARCWLADLPDEGLELPSVVYEVSRRARVLADTGSSGPLARARVRSTSGRWLTVHGARLRPATSDRPTTGVIVEPASRADLAPLMIQAGGLTAREVEITGMLMRGLSITKIASALWLSPHTVRDHVKAVFGKLGVRSRPELTAMLFHEHNSL